MLTVLTVSRTFPGAMEILRAKRITTMDPANPHGEALVVDGGRVCFVGAWNEAVRRYGSRRDAQFIDLGENVVLPGFNDNHLHLMSLGQFFATPHLSGLDRKGIVEKLRETWKDAPAGSLLVARGWDYPACPDPDRETLDRAFPDNPVALIQFSGHGAWLNSRALEFFRIARSTPDPPGGRIMRDAEGELTGILTDDAVRPIHQRRFREAMRSFTSAAPQLSVALEKLAAVGVTSVGDNTWLPAAAGYYNRFRAEGRLTVRVNCWSYGELWYGEPLMRLRRFDREWVTRGAVKLFLDGTFSTRTAWLVGGYPDEPEHLGTATHRQEWLERTIGRYARQGRQVAAHAIGDGAVRAYINAVAAAAQAGRDTRSLRIRVEHGQLVHPDDIPRMAELGVLASAQPHAAADPAKDRAILGEELYARAYPYRSLLDAGVRLSFGSDVPGEETFAPLYGIQLAVDREHPQAITVEEALAAYTSGSAHAEFAEQWKGRLAEGMAADLVVLEDDPAEVPARSIARVSVLQTVVDGRVVYDSRDGYLPEGRAIAESSSARMLSPSAAGGANESSHDFTA
jgi:predicted amidohydrolase YtcJ